MKRILYLHAGAEMYGADKVLLDLLKGINKEEFLPYVILPSDGILVNKMREAGIKVDIVEYPILRRKYFNILGIIIYMYKYIKHSRVLINMAKDYKIDIIHTNTAAVFEGIVVSMFLRIPQIWHIHEIIVNPKYMFKIITYIVAKTSRVCVTVSNAVRNHLEYTGYFKNEVKVIYNGVDSDYFNPEVDFEYLYDEFAISKDCLVIGMLGRVNSWKGQHDFVDALELVMDKKSEAVGLIVGSAFEGEGWRVQELKKRLNESRHKEKFVFSEYRTDNAAIFSLIDIFVLPSTNPDPLPTVVLEAMASGCPIVGYRHGGICEMVEEGDNGYLCEIKNTKELYEKIFLLVSNENLQNNMARESRKRQSEKFSLRSYICNFENLYREI